MGSALLFQYMQFKKETAETTQSVAETTTKAEEAPLQRQLQLQV